MTILNRRKFMQLLAGTAIAATVPLSLLPEVSAPVDGINNALTVTDVTFRAGKTWFDHDLRTVSDWSNQIVSVYGHCENGNIRRNEKYMFAIEASEMSPHTQKELLEFVEGKLTPEHLVQVDYETILRGI